MTIPKIYRSKTVNNVDVFFREAGAVDAPDLLMLHGFFNNM